MKPARKTSFTPNVSGVYANFLRPSISNAGLDPDNLAEKTDVDFGQELEVDADKLSSEKAQGAWKDIWSAGQGVGAIHNIPATADLIDTLTTEYHTAVAKHAAHYAKLPRKLLNV